MEPPGCRPCRFHCLQPRTGREPGIAGNMQANITPRLADFVSPGSTSAVTRSEGRRPRLDGPIRVRYHGRPFDHLVSAGQAGSPALRGRAVLAVLRLVRTRIWGSAQPRYVQALLQE